MQLVSETRANPRINGKAATVSRLYSITPPGFLVGGATDPMKGEANVLTLLTRNKRFATDAWAWLARIKDYMCYRAMMRVRKLSLVRCLAWVVVVFGSGTALAKTS